MNVLIINKLDKEESAEDYRLADYEVNSQFFPSCQYVNSMQEETEKTEIEDFLGKILEAGGEVDYDKRTFKIPNKSDVIGRFFETWMNVGKLNEELDSCDRSASGFLNLLSSLKYWIEYANALPVVVDGLGYNTITQALENMEKDTEYTVCQALYMKA